MAFDTVVDKEFLENGLTVIADAIRSGTGSEESVAFPDGFVGGINVKTEEMKALIERTTTDIYNSNVVRVAPYSFYKHPYLEQAEFPNAASAGESAFEECSTLTGINLPNAEIIGKATFKKCTNLSSISLPKVYEVRVNAFDGCTALASIDLPSLKTLGQYAFAACTALKDLTLPNTVTSIPNHAFRKATNLSTLILESDTVVTLADVGAFYGIELVYVYVPMDLIEAYQTATNWSALYEEGVCVFRDKDEG